MNTDYLTQGRQDAESAQAEVFDEVGIFAEIRFAAEDVDDDFTHADGYLVACPGWCGGSCEVSFVAHHPARQVADGLKVLGKLSAEWFGEPDGKSARQNGNDDESPYRYGSQSMKGDYGKRCTGSERSAKQHGMHPFWSNQFRWFFDGQLGSDFTEQLASLVFSQQHGKTGIRSDLRPFQATLVDEGFAQDVKGALSETYTGGRGGDLAQNEINQQPRGDKFDRFGIIDADIKSIFHRHRDFNAVQAHATSFDSDGGKRQGGVRG